MGRVNVWCCGREVYYNYQTKGGESGIVRCSECGTSYFWKDHGGGHTTVTKQ